jgi:prolyl-tRNA synthetase
LARFGDAGARLSLERLLTVAVEAGHDQDGMVLPAALAPFDVIVTDAGAGAAAEAVYGAITEAGYDTLLDDRDERAGVKFKDADLVGVPWRVTVGKKASDGVVELVNRGTRSRSDVPMDGIVKSLREADLGTL